MDIRTSILGDVLVACIAEPRIDAAVAIRFKDRMRDIIADSASPRIVLDLGAVTFMDSSGLGALVAVLKLCGSERRLELAALTENVARVLRLTRMDAIFVVHPAAPGADGAVGIGDAA
jgi:anti-sigma B factor antagonist